MNKSNLSNAFNDTFFLFLFCQSSIDSVSILTVATCNKTLLPLQHYRPSKWNSPDLNVLALLERSHVSQTVLNFETLEKVFQNPLNKLQFLFLLGLFHLNSCFNKTGFLHHILGRLPPSDNRSRSSYHLVITRINNSTHLHHQETPWVFRLHGGKSYTCHSLAEGVTEEE